MQGFVPVGLPRQPNKGIEGLAFNVSDGSYVIGQEDEPRAVYRLWPNGTTTVRLPGRTEETHVALLANAFCQCQCLFLTGLVR